MGTEKNGHGRSEPATGRPPAPSDLDPLTAASGRPSSEVLSALHTTDAIRLDAAGSIEVAYPFSAQPTRHRVRIAGPRGGVRDVRR
jgi:hypothetical protein